MKSESKGLRLLSLDSGGIRGLSELFILEEIMNRIKLEEGLQEAPKPCEYFDIIGGTGTGGLIAILLGRLRMSVEEAIKAYNKFAEGVFAKTKRKWQDGTFKASKFEAAMKDIVARYDDSGDENTLMMSDVSEQKDCKTFVCAMASNYMYSPRRFRSYLIPDQNQEYNPTIWEAARATSAASTFFKSIKIGTEPKEEFIDSGLRCNNPTDEVLQEAQNIYGLGLPISCIVSIGAGHAKTITSRKPHMFQRWFPMDLMRALEAISTDCENFSQKFERTHGEIYRNQSMRGMKKTYFRFSVQHGLQDVSLAEWTKMSEVKTHTLQYLKGATVDAEIDKVRDLLTTISTDEHQRQGQHIVQVEKTISENFLKQEKVTTSLSVIFETVTLYKRLLSCDKGDVQQVLDAFQTLLDTESFQDRSQLIGAMRRLSERTNLYPTRFFLKGSLYRLPDEPVAAGAFADVYRITFHGEQMCFKAIRLYQRSQVEHMTKVYAREAILWAQLSHPNILPFYGLIRLGSRLGFVSPWAANGNLQNYLTDNPGTNRLLLCSDTAAGVEYLHNNDIVHGDLKGVNVLVDSRGRAALGDFGLASVTDPQILKWTTQSTMVSKGGTARWQAPELLDSEDTSEKNHNTKASDVFAWANVCYEIFTGSVPYHQHRNLTTVMLSVQRGDTPRRPEATDPVWLQRGLTDSIWELMKDCWTFKPSERPDMTTVISRLDVKKPPDSRPPGEWDGKVAMRFRNAQDASLSGRNMLPFWEDLESLLSRVVPG